MLEVPQVVALEQAIAEAGTPLDALMRRAGRFLAFEARRALEGMEGVQRAPMGPVVILCGNGNNGGDGWVAGEYLDRWGTPVRLVTMMEPAALVAEPARAAAVQAAASLSERSQVVLAPTDAEVAGLLDDAPIAIDALLGTGFAHDTVRAPFDGWICALAVARARGTFVVAADVPSGLSAQTGRAAKDAVRADLTVTMIVPKPGLAAGDGVAHCGRVVVAPIAYIEPLL